MKKMVQEQQNLKLKAFIGLVCPPEAPAVAAAPKPNARAKVKSKGGGGGGGDELTDRPLSILKCFGRGAEEMGEGR